MIIPSSIESSIYYLRCSQNDCRFSLQITSRHYYFVPSSEQITATEPMSWLVNLHYDSHYYSEKISFKILT